MYVSICLYGSNAKLFYIISVRITALYCSTTRYSWYLTYQLKCNSTRCVSEKAHFFHRLRKSNITLILSEELPSV
jgi:hypothetical protein